MQAPELVSRQARDTAKLAELHHSGAPTQQYVDFQDELSRKIVDGGGLCTEADFTRSFWPQLQREPDGYAGTASTDVSPAFRLAHHLQRKPGYVVAQTNNNEHPDIRRVQVDRFGIILENNDPASPVIEFSVEEYEDASPDDETEIVADSPYYLGRISVATLWTPNTSTLRRSQDIVEHGIVDKYTILEVERTIGDTGVDVTTMYSCLEEMDLLIGSKEIAAALQDYTNASGRALQQAQGALIAATKTLGDSGRQ